MTPTEFVLWLNGALGVMDDTPTPEQMTKIREKLGETIGKITTDRLLAQRFYEDTFRILATQTNLYAARIDEYSQTLSVGSGNLAGPPPGTIIASAPTSSPKPSGGILGSLLRPAAKARA